MSVQISRRKFAATGAGLLVGASAVGGLTYANMPGGAALQDDQKAKQDEGKAKGPIEAEFERDYDPPSFKPSWKNKQINRTMAQDFVIFAHSNLDQVKNLYDREPGLLNAAMDWGNGDWETALGGASHMGRKDIVEFLLSKGARIDIFCAAMMGMLDVVKAMIELEPELINARGPHGFNLHFHAQVGQEKAKPVLDYLQSVKEIELRPVPFLKKKKKKKSK